MSAIKTRRFYKKSLNDNDSCNDATMNLPSGEVKETKTTESKTRRRRPPARFADDFPVPTVKRAKANCKKTKRSTTGTYNIQVSYGAVT